MTECIHHDEQWGFCYRIRDFRQMCEYEPRCEECPHYKPPDNPA